MSRRMGKFYMTGAFANSDVASKVLAQLSFVPWRTEYLAYASLFECVGTSHLFDFVPEGREIPEYKLCITETDDDEPLVTVERVTQ